MEDRIWNIANIVTGFSVAQNLAFLYGMGRDLTFLQRESAQIKYPVAIAIMIFVLLYLGAVWDLHILAQDMPGVDSRIWLHVSIGRSVAITIFGALAIAGLFAPELYARSGGPLAEMPAGKVAGGVPSR